MKRTPADLTDSALSLENRIPYRFSVLSTYNMRFLAGLTKKFGLTAAGWRILSIIGRFEPIFPTVAAELSTMDADKVTRSVDRLVEMGFVLRSTDTEDRRRVILRLSARGRRIYETIEADVRALEAQLRSVLSAEEWQSFSTILDKLDAQGRRLFCGKGEPAAERPAARGTPVRSRRKSA
jgi:DNA-binding MarR family transcriptional regulator